MNMTEIHSFARQLVDTHGIKAELEAAQKHREAKAEGDESNEDNWRRILLAIREMKPPHVS